MSNKAEIESDLKAAEQKLARLCQEEGSSAKEEASTATVTIKPRHGQEMHHLRAECEELRDILDAMNASED